MEFRMTTNVTVSELHQLPPTIDLLTAAAALGMGRTKAYELARKGQFPCKIKRIGNSYRVVTPDLLRYLEVEPASRT
jgi:hypothetical protein